MAKKIFRNQNAKRADANIQAAPARLADARDGAFVNYTDSRSFTIESL